MQQLWLCLLRGWVASLEAVRATAREGPAWTNCLLRKPDLEKHQIHNDITGAPGQSPSSQWTFPTIATNTFSFVQAGLTWVYCYSENSRARTSWVITDEWRNVGKGGIKRSTREFPGGPVAKILPSRAWGVCSIPGQGAEIPHAPKQNKTKWNVKQKQYCNKFNKDFKNGPYQNTNLKKKNRVWDKMTRWWQPPPPRDFGT